MRDRDEYGWFADLMARNDVDPVEQTWLWDDAVGRWQLVDVKFQ